MKESVARNKIVMIHALVAVVRLMWCSSLFLLKTISYKGCRLYMNILPNPQT